MRLLGALVFVIFATGCSSLHPVVKVAYTIPFTEAGYIPDLGNDLTGPLRALEARLAHLQVTIKPMDEGEFQGGQGNWGSAIPPERTIWMPVSVSVNTRFEVLAHEAAHIYQPMSVSYGLGSELFAEMVAWRIAKHYGHDMTVSSARYLAGRKEALVLEPVYRVDIERVFRILVGKGEVWD